MLRRVFAISFNTYREAVRARILHGLFALAVATGGYALVVGAFAIRDTQRVVADLGAASISLYGIIVAVVLGATSLYREIELKTVFPILARPLSRSEYLVGKFLGTWLTLAVFITANSALLLLSLAELSGRNTWLVVGVALVPAAVMVALGFRLPRLRTAFPIIWSVGVATVAWFLADGAPDERRVVTGSAALSVCEVSIVVALATLFASFTSPFLTAVFTFGVFIVGRSADTLAQLPERVFGSAIQRAGELLSSVVPNLMLYVPPRPLLTGEASGATLATYIPLSFLHALGWSVGLLALAAVIFRRRDFL